MLILSSQCDETRPTCKNCQRQSRTCEYSSGISFVGAYQSVGPSPNSPQYGFFSVSSPNDSPPSRSSAPAHTPPSAPATAPPTTAIGITPTNDPPHAPVNHPPVATAPSPIQPPPPPVEPALNPLNAAMLQDLELMHQWTQFTALTMAFEPRVEEIWQVALPREAARHAFLMHGLLAVAALHLALDPKTVAVHRRRHYRDLGTRHHTAALALYRPVLTAVTPANCHALFGYSCVAPAIAFAASQVEEPRGPRGVVGDLAAAFHMLRGIYAVVHLAWDDIARGALAGFIRPPPPPSPTTGLPAALDAAIAQLHARAAAMFGDDAELGDKERGEREGCAGAIELLRRDFGARVHTPPTDWTRAILWPIEVPRGYVEALSGERPVALAILAFYGVLLDDMRETWWVARRGLIVIQSVAEMLGPEWAGLMEWPLRQVRPEANGAEAVPATAVGMEMEFEGGEEMKVEYEGPAAAMEVGYD